MQRTRGAISSARLQTWWHQLSFGTERAGRRVAALGALGLVAGLAEAAVLVVVIALAAGGGDTGVPLVGERTVGELSGLALAAIGSLAAVHATAAVASARYGAHAERTTQQLLVRAYLAAPWQVQSQARAGELQDLVSDKGAQVAQGVQQASAGVSTAFNLVVVTAAAIAVSVWSTLLLLAMLVVVLGISVPLRARIRRTARAGVAASSQMAVEVTEAAATAREFRVFGVTGAAGARVDAAVAEAAVHAERFRRSATMVPVLTRDASVAVLAIVLAVIAANDDLGLPALGATVLLVLRALAHAQTLAGTAQSLVERDANLAVVLARLEAWRPDSPAGTRPCPRVDRVECRAAGYTYPGEPAPALAGVDLAVARGEMLGIVGRTGAGKSTLASLLLGLLHPTGGEILVDGAPLQELDPADWHARVAWVPQDPRLLSGTVADNVRFLRDIADDRVASALRAAGLDRELEGWEAGTGHPVGPAGANLSGGERQRVALARAIAGDPDLIVLDEPTSALDAHTEAAVREALERLRERAAVVVIAHRLSTVRSCDRVAVLEAGRLESVAPPRELEAGNRWFREALSLSNRPGTLP